MSQTNYQAHSYIDAIVDLLGGADVLGSDLVDCDSLVSVTRAGLPKESLVHLLSVIEASAGGDATTVTWLRAELTRECDDHVGLNSNSSEMTLRIATLLVALFGVFKDVDLAISFLLSPHRSLDGEAPVKAIFTSSGVNAVNRLVGQGQHGMPA